MEGEVHGREAKITISG